MTFSKLPLAVAASTIALLLAAVDCGNLDEFGTPMPTSGASTTQTTTGTGTAATSTTGATTPTATTATTGTTGGAGGTSSAPTTTTTSATGGTGGAGGSGGSGGGNDAGSTADASGGKDAGSDGALSGDGGGATFVQVRSLLSTSCAISGCHGNGNTMQIDLRDTTGLYTRITGQAPATAPTACKGKQLITPSMPTMSLLIAMVDTNATARCAGRMPDGCPTSRPCLTTAQIQMLKDWVTAGAPMQ